MLFFSPNICILLTAKTQLLWYISFFNPLLFIITQTVITRYCHEQIQHMPLLAVKNASVCCSAETKHYADTHSNQSVIY